MTATVDRTCTAGLRCRDYNHSRERAALLDDPRTPLCPDCLRCAERDTRMLVFDYVDLEQELPRSLAQALDSQSGVTRSRELPIPLRGDIEELQRTIWWVTTAWAEVLVDVHSLADPPYQRRLNEGDARTRVRDGYAVRWAVGILTARLPDLARLGPVTLADYPQVDPDHATRHRGVAVADLTGADGVLHLMRLRARTRATLGRVRRTTRVPGRCGCNRDGNYLYRDEPRYVEDPCEVYCGACGEKWTSEAYDQFIGLMTLHPELGDAEGIDYPVSA